MFLENPLLILRCLLCRGTGSGVLKELSELLSELADEPSEEDVLMLEEAEELLSLNFCSKDDLLLEASFNVSSWISPGLFKKCCS